MIAALLLTAFAAPALEVPVQPEPATTGSSPELVLYALPHAQSRFGLPQRYEQARTEFDSAEADHAAGAADRAAPRFMKVAVLLAAPPEETTYSDQFSYMRDVAYKNAAICFELAGQPDAARKAFTLALQQDPQNKQTLTLLLAKVTGKSAK